VKGELWKQRAEGETENSVAIVKKGEKEKGRTSGGKGDGYGG